MNRISSDTGCFAKAKLEPGFEAKRVLHVSAINQFAGALVSIALDNSSGTLFAPR
jgi:hypothetical protein